MNNVALLLFLALASAPAHCRQSTVNDKSLEHLETSLRAFTTFLGGGGGGSDKEADCQYRCPLNAQPKPKPGYRPTFNGCGSQEFHVDTSALPAITECCNRHDICYGTCNTPKSACESRFSACLNAACDSIRPAPTQTPEKIKAYSTCRSLSSLFHGTVQNIGCQFYLEAQAEACQCPGQTDHEERQQNKNSENEKSSSKTSAASFLDFGAEHYDEEL